MTHSALAMTTSALGRIFLWTFPGTPAFRLFPRISWTRKPGKRFFRTHLIQETGGLKIAIFSLLSPYFFSGESDPRTRGIVFREPLEEAETILSKIRPEADLVVLLSHLGYTADIDLAEALPGIDVIRRRPLRPFSVLPDANQGHHHCPGRVQGAPRRENSIFSSPRTGPRALTQASRQPFLSPLQTRSITRSRKWSGITR